MRPRWPSVAALTALILTFAPAAAHAASQYHTDPPPTVGGGPGTYTLHKELSGYSNYGVADAAADVLYGAESDSWTFDLAAAGIPADHRSLRRVRVSLVLEDTFERPAGEFTASLAVDGLSLHDGPVATLGVDHGAPFAGQFTNWAVADFPIIGVAAGDTPTVSMANTTTNGPVTGDDWIGIDWIEIEVGPSASDRDHDTVTDAFDRCPDKPGFVDNDGCPARTFVALGDSFSSGESNRPYQLGTAVPGVNECHRSSRAYPNLLRTSLPAGTPFEFHACSGAVVDNMTTTGRWTEPKQLSWLSDDATRHGIGLVTLTIGGNDLGFADVLTYCVLRLPGTRTCEEEKSPLVAAARQRLADQLLPALFTTIAEKANHAKVVVLGYPRFFPVDPPKHCLTGLLAQTFRQSDMRWINAEIAAFDAVIAVAAAAHGFHYVDTYDAFDGHEICAAGSARPAMHRYIHGPNTKGSFHPTAYGQQLLADAARPEVPSW
ncbi:SGNH/GDSL hydrolase family protein [Dactylosporangium sp. NPDC049742]|uniref:SGNH/GDSL hydrolase family protein n=1 Tax=Dactylosporangium sp. NPDC049742 TaxID=3154737 RepID=UPI00342565E6